MILEKISLHDSLITIGRNCVAEALSDPDLDLRSYSSVFVISQKTVWNLYGWWLREAFASLELEPAHYLMPEGEDHKSLKSFGEIQSWLASRGADRKSLLMVLGGGVVGDLAGFVAASYMRGIHWLYVPTTLLAQQDASVGGKVAVNLPEGKNLVGHFWNPRAVIIDSHVLRTLPAREVTAGYMELLKHGMLRSADLYTRVLAMPSEPNWAEVLPLLAEGLKVKVDVVREDPHEKGLRKWLNLGHTFGHALESFTGYRQFLHGEAVGLGLIFATLLSNRLGGDYDWSALVPVVKDRLPDFRTDDWDGETLLDLTRRDKKGVKGVVSWIIPYEPGRVEIVKGVARDVLEDTFQAFIAVLA
jgi:3-dehydroquinate synthase